MRSSLQSSPNPISVYLRDLTSIYFTNGLKEAIMFHGVAKGGLTMDTDTLTAEIYDIWPH
jgi:hypothetical protein